MDPLKASLKKYFTGGPRLELELEADFERAPVHVLFGPSGSGKSTLLRMLCGLSRPDEGTIYFRGQTWFDSTPGIDLRPQQRKIGFLPQIPALFTHLSVLANVAYSGADPEPWLEQLGLEALRHRYPHQLSGGQKQRVALARALAASPAVLCLDEPFSSLDAPAREELRLELKALLRKLRVPALLVTHDRTEAHSLGDMVHLLDRGRIVQSGPVENVFDRPADVRAARILGVENLLEAQVGSPCSSGLPRCRLGAQDFACSRDPQLPVGLPVRLGLRAEDVEILWEPAACDQNQLNTRVTAVISEGPWTRLLLRTQDHINVVALLPKRALPRQGVREGDSVWARLPPESIQVLQDFRPIN